MELIIQPEEVGTLARPISQHIDREQLVAYITEVEQLQIRPTLGGVLYNKLKKTPEDYDVILSGGIDSFGEVIGGIRTAMAYYVYARIIREGGTIPTRWGAVEKTDEYATRLEQEQKNTIYRECSNIADAYMKEVVRYAKNKGLLSTSGIGDTRRTTYVIGEEKGKRSCAANGEVKYTPEVTQGDGIIVNGKEIGVDFNKVASKEYVNEGLREEVIQRMAADTSLGNRITTLDNKVNEVSDAIPTQINSAIDGLGAVKTTGAQAISGVKTFNDNLSIANKTTIAKNIDGGELKVLHHGSSKGFIVRTRNTSDTLLPLEMLTTNGYQSYTYVFPAKGGTMALIEDVSAAVAGAIAQVVANAPEDLDTIKEVADYIAADKTKAVEIEVNISALLGKCSSLESAIDYYNANYPYLTQEIAIALEESARNRVMIEENILPRLNAGLLSENDKQALSRTVYMGTFSRSGDAEAKAAEYANDRSKVFLLYDLEDGGSGVVEQAFSNTAATIQFLYLKGSRYVREVKWATGEIGSWKNITGSERISGLSFNPSTGVLSLKDALGARDWGSVTLSLSGVPENLTTMYTTPVPFFGLSKIGHYLIHLDNLYTRTDFETTGNSTTSLTDAYQNKGTLSDGIYEYLKDKNLSNNSNLKADISVNAFDGTLIAEIFVWAPYEYRLYAKLVCWLGPSGDYKVINEIDFTNEQDSNT